MEQRFYNDIKDIFKEQNLSENPLIYEFNNIVPVDSENDLLYGITTIYPGKIGLDYYMTRGHKHLKNCAEVYYCLEGKGLIKQQYNDTVIADEIFTGDFIYIKPGFSHRAINTGSRPLKLLCVCRADAGHNYSVEFINTKLSDAFMCLAEQKPVENSKIQIIYTTDDGNNLISECLTYINEDSLRLAKNLSKNIF